MNIAINNDTYQMLMEELEAGHFSSLDDVLQSAIANLRLKEELDRFDELQRELQVGMDQLERGEGIPFDMERLRREAHELLRQQQS